MPVADEVYRLQNGRDPESRFFQQIAEEGHYGGRPGTTRQGTYIATPSGAFLASVNSNDPDRILRLLREGLAKWEALAQGERVADDVPDRLAGAERTRPERHYPEGGLVLRVFSRDLPREEPASGWRGQAWNQDFAWFTQDEARSLLPADLAVGRGQQVPEALVQRLARASLVDNVRGQTSSYPARAVDYAAMTTEVTAVDGSRVTLLLQGATRTSLEGNWSVGGQRDPSTGPQQRGYVGQLLGRATYDAAAERFVAFELVSLGTRWGGTQFNNRGRWNDLAPAGLGFALTLAGDTPAERVAPAHLGAYGWR